MILPGFIKICYDPIRDEIYETDSWGGRLYSIILDVVETEVTLS
jgi:hypothetical protein